jgi:hypothetical protein
MQVGPDIHLLYEGNFYLPDVLAEHTHRLFKDFNPEQGKGLNILYFYFGKGGGDESERRLEANVTKCISSLQ